MKKCTCSNHTGSRDIFLSGPQLTAYGIRTPTGNNNEIYLAQGVPDVGFIHFSSHALQQDVTLLDDVHGTAHYATRDTRIFAFHFSTGITINQSFNDEAPHISGQVRKNVYFRLKTNNSRTITAYTP